MSCWRKFASILLEYACSNWYKYSLLQRYFLCILSFWTDCVRSFLICHSNSLHKPLVCYSCLLPKFKSYLYYMSSTLYRQAFFIMCLFMAKPVFLYSVFTVKPVFVNSVGHRVFQKNLKLTNSFSILKMKSYSIRCMKYFYLWILRHNLAISCIKVKYIQSCITKL